MTKRDQRYIEALTLAHMLARDHSQEEDLLVEALGAARDRLGDAVIDKFQVKAATLRDADSADIEELEAAGEILDRLKGEK